MTHRQAFETAKAHLLKQGKQSFLPSDPYMKQLCAYRGQEGLKCAIGCLIPDEEYQLEFETRSASYVQDQGVPSLQGLSPVFLDELQLIHDDSDPADWAWKLDRFEEEYAEELQN